MKQRSFPSVVFSLNSEYCYRTLAEKTGEQIKELLDQTHPHSDEFWRWKHEQYPGRDPPLIVVAEKDSNVVGCGYWLPSKLKVSKSLVIKSLLATELAVHPEHRRRGVATNLARCLRLVRNPLLRGALIILGFTRPELGKRLLKQKVSSVPIFNRTTTYTIFLNCDLLKKLAGSLNKVIELNGDLRANLKNIKISVLFRLKGAPPFIVKISNGEIEVAEEEAADADLEIKSDLFLLIHPHFSLVTKRGKKRITNLVKALLQRKLIVRGNLPKIIKLYKVLKTFDRSSVRKTLEDFWRQHFLS